MLFSLLHTLCVASFKQIALVFSPPPSFTTQHFTFLLVMINHHIFSRLLIVCIFMADACYLHLFTTTNFLLLFSHTTESNLLTINLSNCNFLALCAKIYDRKSETAAKIYGREVENVWLTLCCFYLFFESRFNFFTSTCTMMFIIWKVFYQWKII